MHVSLLAELVTATLRIAGFGDWADLLGLDAQAVYVPDDTLTIDVSYWDETSTEVSVSLFPLQDVEDMELEAGEEDERPAPEVYAEAWRRIVEVLRDAGFRAEVVRCECGLIDSVRVWGEW